MRRPACYHPRRFHIRKSFSEAGLDSPATEPRIRLLNDARAARARGDLDAAQAACRTVLAEAPQDVEALDLMAGLAADRGLGAEGLEWAGRALQAGPSSAAVHFTLGRLLEMQERLAEAEQSYRRALELAPDHARAHNNLGVVLQVQGRAPEALACYRRALELDPRLPEANQNYASITRDHAALERSVDGFRQRIADNPRDPVSFNSLANALRELGRHDEALAAYDSAVALAPDFADARFNRAMVRLQTGDYAQGWKDYEWRLQTAAHGAPAQRFAQPMWQGADTARAVLLHAEQGLGDTLQFVRYAPLVARRCALTVLECQPELKTLLEAMKGAPRIVARGEPLPPFDLHAPLLSLPSIFGTTLDTIPWEGPYLEARPEWLARWRKAFRKRARRFNVGLVWAGRPQHWDDLNRSVPLALFAPLARSADVCFFSLQLGPAAAEAAAPPPGMLLADLTPAIRDFSDTAALVGLLDLVITVDTSAAHLAGAMGRPTWVLLAHAPDWRYHLRRSDNPWYPGMRLFRQPRDGDWSGAIEQMAQELAKAAAGKR